MTYPEPVLQQVAEPVTEFNKELWAFATKLTATMYHAHGIGLAAPQVGVSKRIVVVDVAPSSAQPASVLVNPEIIKKDIRKISIKEGCLSFPNTTQRVTRAKSITCRYQNLDGTWIRKVFKGLEAICVQHEIDHLDGITIADSMSEAKKSNWTKRLE